MRKKKFSRQVGVLFSEETVRQLVKVTNTKEISLSEFIRQIVEKELTKTYKEGHKDE
jgi:hypothetical protein